MNASAIILNIQAALNSFSLILRGGSLADLGRWDYLLLGLLLVIQGPVAPPRRRPTGSARAGSL